MSQLRKPVELQTAAGSTPVDDVWTLDGALQFTSPVEERMYHHVAPLIHGLRAMLNDGYSKVELARGLGISRQGLENLLTGKSWPKLQTALQMQALTQGRAPDRPLAQPLPPRLASIVGSDVAAEPDAVEWALLDQVCAVVIRREDLWDMVHESTCLRCFSWGWVFGRQWSCDECCLDSLEPADSRALWEALSDLWNYWKDDGSSRYVTEEHERVKEYQELASTFRRLWEAPRSEPQ